MFSPNGQNIWMLMQQTHTISLRLCVCVRVCVCERVRERDWQMRQGLGIKYKPVTKSWNQNWWLFSDSLALLLFVLLRRYSLLNVIFLCQRFSTFSLPFLFLNSFIYLFLPLSLLALVHSCSLLQACCDSSPPSRWQTHRPCVLLSCWTQTVKLCEVPFVKRWCCCVPFSDLKASCFSWCLYIVLFDICHFLLMTVSLHCCLHQSDVGTCCSVFTDICCCFCLLMPSVIYGCSSPLCDNLA